MQDNSYDETRLYDLMHDKAPDGREVLFYRRQIEKYGSPVLEIACGTGIYLVNLARHGVDIAGLDLSAEMLRAAAARAEKHGVRAELIEADMRFFELDRRFSLILIAGNSLQHLDRREDAEACFAAVKKHLEPGGKLIVEVFNPSLRLLARDPRERHHVRNIDALDGDPLVLTESVCYDPATQINHIDWHFKNRSTNAEKTVSFTMRQFFPQELDALFFYNGFRIEAKYGDFDESALTGGSPKQIILASVA